METVYETNLDTIVEHVRERQHWHYDPRTARMQRRIRQAFYDLTGIPEEVVLLSYGEQPDPPLVKHTAKSVLAAVIERRLQEQGISCASVCDVLPSDSFGSNFDIFKQWGLLTKNKADYLGQQTYAKAPIPKGYRERLRQVLLDAAPDDRKAFVLGLQEDTETIGDIHRFYRQALETEFLPLFLGRFSLSDLENVFRADVDFMTELVSYSGQVGKLGKGFFVLWKGAPRPMDPNVMREWTDTGYRRYFVSEDSGAFQIVPPYKESTALYRGSLEQVLSHPNVEGISFDASSRAVLCYLLANTGVNITGGGSSYNEVVARTYTESGFPKPVICYLGGLGDSATKPLSVLLGRRERIARLVDNAGQIQTTDATDFVETLGG